MCAQVHITKTGGFTIFNSGRITNKWSEFGMRAGSRFANAGFFRDFLTFCGSGQAEAEAIKIANCGSGSHQNC